MPNPIVVLPGYYGTLLLDRVSNETIWLTLDGVANSGEMLEAIRLDTGDPSRIVSGDVFDELDIFPFWSPNVYKGLLIFVGSLGLPKDYVVPFGIDWRQSVEFTIDNLQHKIVGLLGQTGEKKVDIVAHSHGGLVARAYLKKHSGALVENLITLGTPHKGMLRTFEALDRGISFLGFSKAHVSEVSRSFPSAYELLPVDANDGLFTVNNKNADPFTSNGWVFDATSKKMLAAAGKVMLGLPAAIPVKTTIIFGSHRLTTTRASASAQGKLRFFETTDGDGTVPQVSAAANGITSDVSIARFGIPFGVHTRLFEYETAQRVMKNVLLNRPMPHVAFAFEKPMYRSRDTIGFAVDLRHPNGAPIDDANVRLTLRGHGQEIRPQFDPIRGDFHVNLQMPAAPVHLQYKVRVEAGGLPTPVEQVGMLWAANG